MQTKIFLAKKYLITFLAAVLLLGIFVIGNSQTVTPGDVNGDGSVNIIDALLIARYSAGLNPPGINLSAMDVNCDGTVNIIDALLVARYTAGLVPIIICSATPTPVPTTLVPGVMINAKSAKLLTPTSSATTGSIPLVQKDYSGPQFSYKIQEWEFGDVEGYHTIINKQSRMVLTVENASTQAGAYVVASPVLSSSNAHQQWQFFKTPSGYVKIVNRQSGLCLGVEGASLLADARLIQVADTNGSEILWGSAEVIPPPSPTGCDMVGYSFCFGVTSTTIKENSTTPAILQVTANKMLVSPPPIRGSNIVVNYTLNGTAINGQDVQLLSGQVTVFAENYTGGDTTTPPADGKIFIQPINDTQVEGIETLKVNLSFPEQYTNFSGGIVYIVDDDLQPIISTIDSVRSAAGKK